jgi:broad specificity phosphatase PhoE
MHGRDFVRLLRPALLVLILITLHAPSIHAQSSRSQATNEPMPEEKMRRRFPHPVKVADLIGLPVLDYSDSTIGFVREVARTSQGKIVLVVNHGWIFGWGGRRVGVPIEVVGILGRQINALDMSREEFASAPTWSDANGVRIAPDENILIALARR